MFTEEQLKQMRKVVGEVVKPLEAGQKRLETEVAQMKTTLEAVTAGGQTLATRADIQDIMAELKNHKRRIENLEEQIKTPNPYKH